MHIEAAGLVYNPYLHLDNQIRSASKGLTEVFSDIDTALDKGRSVRHAVNGDRISAVMRKTLAQARLEGFQAAAKHAKVQMPVLYGQRILNTTRVRAAKINDLMNRTTRKTLRRVPDSNYILSAERGLTVARFELSRMYFKGVGDAYRGTDFRKKWNANEDACPECLMTEDEGRIDVSDSFDNGYVFPPGHLSCGCWLVITR